MARKKKPRSLQVPPGLYDPALDSAFGAGARGLGDLQADYGRDFGAGYGGGRVGHDYQLGLADLDTKFKRGTEDYTQSIAGLQRNYTRLGRQQAEGARSHGVLSGGLAARAAQIRASNQAFDRAPIDQGLRRFGEDIQHDRGELGLQYQRAGEDAQLGLTRAGREQTQFGLDTNAARVFSATQAGWDPTVPPKPKKRRRGGHLVGTVGQTRVSGPFW